MISDRLNNSKQYYLLGEKIKKGFEFLINSDLKNMADGKYLIEDEEIFANVQTLETKTVEEKKWEAHRKYIDIQYVISGREKMGYGILEDFEKEIIPYSDEKDIVFLDGRKFNYIDVDEGNFVIFYPNDVHAPMLSVEKSEKIKKVIVKIKI
jgi:YhcH/YjgK/YiaL family protein